jgi:hypothetical protein
MARTARREGVVHFALSNVQILFYGLIFGPSGFSKLPSQPKYDKTTEI